MASPRLIQVSLMYATQARQWRWEGSVRRGTSARELIERSGFMRTIECMQQLDVDALELGVFAQRVSQDYVLENGDRVEIYRNLRADPKEVRRQLASLGKTMGRPV